MIVPNTNYLPPKMQVCTRGHHRRQRSGVATNRRIAPKSIRALTPKVGVTSGHIAHAAARTAGDGSSHRYAHHHLHRPRQESNIGGVGVTSGEKRGSGGSTPSRRPSHRHPPVPAHVTSHLTGGPHSWRPEITISAAARTRRGAAAAAHCSGVRPSVTHRRRHT